MVVHRLPPMVPLAVRSRAVPPSASGSCDFQLAWTEQNQPHDDRDNCFPPFDSKGPCGMTVLNDIDNDGASEHSDSHRSPADCCSALFPIVGLH